MSKIDQVVEIIMSMTVPELIELGEVIQAKFGVSAMMQVAPAQAQSGGAAPVEAAEEQTEFDVILTSSGANKINVIKVVRTITNLGLKEAKDMVEGVPATVKKGVSKADAESVKKQLEEAGATVEIK